MRRPIGVTALVACLSLPVGGCGTGPGSGVDASVSCRPDPLANVHNPDRLELRDPCVTVTGVVRRVVSDPHDGDDNFDLAVDPPFRRLIGAGNRRKLDGLLHIEIVPADQTGCRHGAALPPVNGMDVGHCTGAEVKLPAVGDHVEVTGAFVVDRNNAWREIHPAWLVRRW